jgi:hypothetical protein
VSSPQVHRVFIMPSRAELATSPHAMTCELAVIKYSTKVLPLWP